MFETIKRLYESKKLTGDGVRRAVAKGWISSEQADEILNPDK